VTNSIAIQSSSQLSAVFSRWTTKNWFKSQIALENDLQVEEAADGQEAVELVRKAEANKNPYKLIFLDVNMPIMGGLDVLNHLEEKRFTYHFYLIDGSGYIFRAYYALPPLTRKTDGLPVGAVSGFCNMLYET
jgi:CheY-like chemotaxis protein